jgi:hypothetical protein
VSPKGKEVHKAREKTGNAPGFPRKKRKKPPLSLVIREVLCYPVICIVICIFSFFAPPGHGSKDRKFPEPRSQS